MYQLIMTVVALQNEGDNEDDMEKSFQSLAEKALQSLIINNRASKIPIDHLRILALQHQDQAASNPTTQVLPQDNETDANS